MDLDQSGYEEQVEANPRESDNSEFSIEDLGAHVAFPYSPEPHYLSNDSVLIPDEWEDTGDRDTSPLSEDAKKSLMELDLVFSQAEVAPRRIEIEQSWKACHYDRGYQFLLHNRNGGWTMPAWGQFSPSNQRQTAQLYATNVYGEKGEIIKAALAREVPKVEFFPANPDHAPDQDMADVADDLKDIWAKNNNLMALLQNCASIFWNEDRCLLWTRYVLNGDEYGYEETDEPVVPEDESNPPTQPEDTEGDTQYREVNESIAPQANKRRPRGRTITSALGKLAHKVPIFVSDQANMPVVSIYFDHDESIAKAMFPWMRDKVHGGGDATGATELDRIARENVRAAVPGQYVTGDAIQRHAVVKFVYIRQSAFFDGCVKDPVRKELLEKFPDGALLCKCATEFAFARNECIDDHLTIMHPFPGEGQNRRALGESLLSVQDYINELVCLALDFAKRTISKKWMDSEAFNVEALKQQTNVPGSIGPFQRQPGVPVDQLIFIEPTPTPQPWLITWIQWIITSLSEQISGALPSLFGAAIENNGNVGSEGIAIQRDQALQRVGCPWNALQNGFAEAARQAVCITAKCTNKDINDVIPGKGKVSIKVNNLKGNVLCYPESDPSFPESWAQRETRVMGIVDMALKSPDSEMSKMVTDPINLKAIKAAIRMPGFVIKGADAVEKQEAEFELLLRSGPLPNPQKMKLAMAVQAGQQVAQQAQVSAAAGLPVDPQIAQVGQMVQQAQQALQSMPDMISTVKVRDDGSENYEVEASVCMNWMNSPDGRKFANGSPDQQAAFENVHLHWTETMAAAKKVAAENAAPPIPPKVSFSVSADKMPPPEQAAIMSAGGIPANPQDFAMHAVSTTEQEIAKKVVPDQVYLSGLHKDSGSEEKSEPSDKPPGFKSK